MQTCDLCYTQELPANAFNWLSLGDSMYICYSCQQRAINEGRDVASVRTGAYSNGALDPRARDELETQRLDEQTVYSYGSVKAILLSENGAFSLSINGQTLLVSIEDLRRLRAIIDTYERDDVGSILTFAGISGV